MATPWLQHGTLVAPAWIRDLSYPDFLAFLGLSDAAIEVARVNAAATRAADRLQYRTGDAADLPFAERSFAHVVAGCCFGFIQAREAALSECARVVESGGYLCTATLYYRAPAPDALLSRVAQVIGYRPDPRRDRDYWQRFYTTHWRPVGERLYAVEPQAEGDVAAGVQQLFGEAEPTLRSQPDEVREACFERLLTTRRVINEHRRYQGLSVAVWSRP